MSETRFLIDFRQTTDLKNATRYEQKKRKRKKKQLKSQEAKKKKENTLRNDVSGDVHRKCQARAKKKKHDVDVDDASSDAAATSLRAAALSVCVLGCQQVALWGGRAACVDCNCDGDVDVANLDLDLETRWRFWGDLGAFYGCVFVVSFFSLPAAFFLLFFARFLARGFKIKSVYCVGGRSLCVSVWVALIGFGAMYVLGMPGRGECKEEREGG